MKFGWKLFGNMGPWEMHHVMKEGFAEVAVIWKYDELTHSGLMIPYGDIDISLGQHGLR